MGLNDIELSAQVIETLYPSSLIGTVNSDDIVETAPVHKKTINTDNEKWPSLGENKKNILILVHHQDATHLPDEELQFLTGILSACKLSLADVAIINLHHYTSTGYKEIISYFKSKVVFMFGIDPVDFGLPMSFPHFQVQPFDKSSFLYSPPLKELQEDETLKRKLWAGLKRIFNL